MIVGISIESYPNESRVALVPTQVTSLINMGLKVLVERGAGQKAGFLDVEYEKQGAQLTSDREELFAKADVLLQIHGLGGNPDTGQADFDLIRSGQIIIGLLNPLGVPEAVQELAKKGATAFALELLPRIGKAQSMDALTSMATIIGYKAVILAAGSLKKIFPMMITAAGTIPPVKVLVIGAGVIGLEAIATAHRLGATVKGYDIRPATKEQVESLGAKFLELGLENKEVEATSGYAKKMDEEFYRRQRELMTRAVAESDVVITTAAIPGKKAPILITKEMVHVMQPGSVIVDVAAEEGGNCELTQSGKSIEVNEVTIMGPINLPSTIPYHGSQMYAKNVTSFLGNMVENGRLNLNMKDPVIRDTLLTHEGEVVHPKVREILNLLTLKRGA